MMEIKSQKFSSLLRKTLFFFFFVKSILSYSQISYVGDVIIFEDNNNEVSIHINKDTYIYQYSESKYKKNTGKSKNRVRKVVSKTSKQISPKHYPIFNFFSKDNHVISPYSYLLKIAIFNHEYPKIYYYLISEYRIKNTYFFLRHQFSVDTIKYFSSYYNYSLRIRPPPIQFI